MAGEKTYLKPIKSKSVVQQVIDRVTEAIIDRRIHPGDKIPTEQELAESFGVSRNSREFDTCKRKKVPRSQ